jgi:hypothetical protein
VVRANLRAIGIDVEIREVDEVGAVLERGGAFDLVEGSTEILYPNPASFLTRMLVEDVPRSWSSTALRLEVERLSARTGDRLHAATGALADRLATNEVPVAAYSVAQIPTFLSPRLGCRVFAPLAFGIDLAALCLAEPRGGSDT